MRRAGRGARVALAGWSLLLAGCAAAGVPAGSSTGAGERRGVALAEQLGDEADALYRPR